MMRWITVSLLLALAPATAAAQIATVEEIQAVGGPQAARELGKKLAKGHELYKAGNPQGALDLYNEIKERLPGSAWIYFYIGTALRKLEQWEDSLAAFRTTATIAGSKDIDMRAKAMFNIALTHEHRAGEEPGPTVHWKNAKAAWIEYLKLAEAHPDAIVFPDSARSRIKAIERRFELWEQYRRVREEAEKRGKGGND